MNLELIDKESEELLKNQRFLQSSFWAEFKSVHGWKPLRFKCKDTVSFECSVLVRDFKLPVVGKCSIAYVPMGIDLISNPEILMDAKKYSKILEAFAVSVKEFLPKRTLCLRFDIPVDFTALEDRKSYVKALTVSKCCMAPDNIQPPDTVNLDLSLSEDELLENMKNKWRYNIRLAQKKNVVVKKGSAQDIDVFYDLYKTTAQRDGIAIHSKDYYLDLLNRSDDKNQVSLYIASHEEQPLAAIITLFTPKEAVYLYGASSNEKRNLMPAYLLQWNAICDAKNAACKTYDFYGIPPTDDEKHPMHGLYRFKTGFGGLIIHRPGSVDISMSSLYKLYTFAERLRNFWYKKVKKLLAGR